MTTEIAWVAAQREAERLGVRVVVTPHTLCRMDQYDVRLLRHAAVRGGGYVLLVWAALDHGQAARGSLRALARLSMRAWMAYGDIRKGA